jgi:hypothetical protein
VVKTLEAAFKKASEDQEFLSLASKANLKPDPEDSKGFFAIAQDIYNEIKGQEENLKLMIKPEK